MNKRFFFVPALLLFALVLVSSAYASVTSNPVFYYSFDTGHYSGTTVYDLSGTGNNGTTNGTAIAYGTTNGIIGLSANSTNWLGTGYVTTSSFTGLTGAHAWTFNEWVWINQTTTATAAFPFGTRGIYANLNTLSGSNYTSCRIAASSTYSFACQVQQKKWVMLTYEYDGSRALLWVNAVLQGNSSLTQSLTNSNWHIGADFYNGDNGFEGAWDEAYLSSDAKTQADINTLYNGGAGYNPFTPTPTYFSLTATDAVTHSSLTTFNATINGTAYSTTNGTINTAIPSSPGALVAVSVDSGLFYFNYNVSSYNVSSNLQANLTPWATIYAHNVYDNTSVSNFTVSNITGLALSYTATTGYVRAPIGNILYNATITSPQMINTANITNGIGNTTANASMWEAELYFNATLDNGTAVTGFSVNTSTQTNNSNPPVLILNAGTYNVTFTSSLYESVTQEFTVTAPYNGTQTFTNITVPPLVPVTNFTSSGVYTVPLGVSQIYVEVFGGGGGGQADGTSGGGGGGGAFASSFLNVTPGQNWTVIVGTGGTSGHVTTPGNGGNSSFSFNGTNVTAQGGLGGGPAGGAGGSYTVGNLATQPGGNGQGTNLYGGGGGGGSGVWTQGGNGIYNGAGGVGGTYYGGSGGDGGFLSAGNGLPGVTYGGGGGGGYVCGSCGAVLGGAGANGIVSVYTVGSGIGFLKINVYDANSGLFTNQYSNVTLYPVLGGTTITYYFNNTELTTIIPAGTYLAFITTNGYPPVRYTVTVPASTSQLANFYVDSLGQQVTFINKNTLGVNLGNITNTFTKYFNGSWITVAQVTSDFSGSFAVYLNPAQLYDITSVDTNGVYSPSYNSVVPNPAVSPYTITMYESGGGSLYPPNSSLTNTTYLTSGTYDNATSTVNLTFEVSNTIGGLSSFSFNTSYNGTPLSNTFSSAPTGGKINITISPVDLNTQSVFVVDYNITNTGYASDTFEQVFSFNNVPVNNGSITGGLFGSDYLPSSLVGRAILGGVILLVGAGFMVFISGSVMAGVLAGFILAGMLGFVGLFPLIPTIIVMISGVLVLLGDTVVNR